MRKNMLAVFIMALTMANLIISSITLMVVMPSLKNTNEFVAKVAAAIELEELENKEEVGLDEMENYIFWMEHGYMCKVLLIGKTSND